MSVQHTKHTAIFLACFLGLHLSLVLEEQRPAAENSHGGYQEGISFTLREQHSKAAKAMC